MILDPANLENTDRSPMTPQTPLQSASNRNSTEDKTHKKLLETRRVLVLEFLKQEGLFPTTKATSDFQVNIIEAYTEYTENNLILLNIGKE